MSEKILEAVSSEQLKTDYTRYGIYILYRRVLSDYRDGLKPVQRRIIWAMYKNTKAISTYVKSAAVVGDVMKLYHPHGDCLEGSTKIMTTSGQMYTIQELYEKGIESIDVYAIDKDGNVVTAKAHSFRIGQVTEKEITIWLNNGTAIKCTDNHPFMMKDMTWKHAIDLKINDELLYIDGMNKGTVRVKAMRNMNHMAPIPFYDFTVDEYENMLIPANGKDSPKPKFICAHNSAIYGTMKPMANWFETHIPLIEPSGNFGTFQGDQAAAPRYTECRLSKFSMENVLADLIDSTDAVDWSLTYNEVAKEPDYLPVKVPLLLINGSFGIGLGMRAEIPTHNLSEVIDATLLLMDNPNAEITLVPDHCMNCEIIDTDFSKICRAGFGHYRVRGKIDIEDYKGKTALIIKSVPNLTYLNGITDKIEDLIKKKKIIQIDTCFDESNVDEMRYVIVLKNGSDPNYVKEVLYKNTNLEQTLRINFETLNGFNPLRMSYKSYLLSFIDFRRMTKFRVYSNKLQDIQTKIHEKDAYIKVLESGEIDNIIDTIKKQKTIDDTKLIEYLIKRLKITDLQAKYIIEADLKKLSYGYLEKYKAEAIDLTIAKNELMAHIMDDKVIENDIRNELLAIKAKYGKPRNCKIISANTGSDIPSGEMVIAITEKNFVKKVPYGTNMAASKNDSIKTMIKLDNTDSMLIFDEMGKVFKLPIHKIPFTDKASSGTDIRFLIKSLTANICTIIPESVLKTLADKGHHNNKHYLVTISNAGLIKRMDLDDFLTVPPSGILYAKLDNNDYMKDIVVAHSTFNLAVYSDKKAVIMNVNDAPYLKRNTKGSRAMKADQIDGLCVIHNNCTDIVVITESGRVNRLSVIQNLQNSGKGKAGSNLIKLSAGDKIISVVCGNPLDRISVKFVSGESKDIIINDLKVGSSISSGDKIFNTRGNKILRAIIQN